MAMMMTADQVTVTASLSDGGLKAVWHGSPLIERGGNHLIAATWRRARTAVASLVFEPGDTVVEYYSESKWFNVIAVWDRMQRRQRGWYVNLAKPVRSVRTDAELKLNYTDLALDYVVTRDRVIELDTSEWVELADRLPTGERTAAEAAAKELRRRLVGRPPAEAWSWLEQLFAQAVDNRPGARWLAPTAGRYGVPLVTRCTFNFDRGDRLEYWRDLQARGRRVAEAIYVLRQGGGSTLLHTKAFYPDGVFRLPGGGVDTGECPAEAAVREAREEIGLRTRVVAFLAYGDFMLTAGEQLQLPMPTYVFLLESVDADAEPTASTEEQITGLRTIPWQQLGDYGAHLMSLTGEWRDWGYYRGVPHLLAHQAIAAAARPVR